MTCCYDCRVMFDYNGYNVCPACQRHREMMAALQPQQSQHTPAQPELRGPSGPHDEIAGIIALLLIVGGVLWLCHSWTLLFIVAGFAAFVYIL